MYKSYKFRLYPNKSQREYFAKCFGSTRFLYNQMLADRQAKYKQKLHDEHFPHVEVVDGYPVKVYKKKIDNRTYTSFKNDYPFLKEVDSLALANAKMDLETAYKNFFKDGNGFPKFKSKKDRNKSYKTNNQGGNIRIENNKIKLPKIGFVKLKQHQQFDGKIKSCAIRQVPSGKYFISILVDEPEQEWIPAKNKIGIDLGLSDFAITTNDDGLSVKYENPRCLRKSEKQLIKAQKSLSRKKIGSKNREKARIKLAKKHEKIVNQRNDFLHKLSHEITSENQVIVIEHLKSSNLVKNHNLAKSIADASWYEFKRQLEYKSEWRGRTLIIADQYFPSSQICSECGCRSGKKALHIREWNCLECGYHHDRDINASKNLLALAN